MMSEIGDYIIYTRFGFISDFKVGKVIKRIDPILYIMKYIYVYGIEITGGDGTFQLSTKAPIVKTTKDEWKREVIKNILLNEKNNEI